MTNTNEQLIDVEAGQVYVKYWQENQTDKLPIILFHDSLGSVAMWRDFPEILLEQTEHPVIAYDRLGFGQSSIRNEAIELSFIEDEAIAFNELKQQLGITNYIAIGHSVGGAMAINVAAQDPECRAVITIAAQAFVEAKTLHGIEDAAEQFKSEQHFARLKKWHGERTQWVLDSWINSWLAPEFKKWSLIPALSNVTCPVLAIHGKEDEYGSSEFALSIATHCQGPSDVLIINDCAHMPHREQTDSCLSAISKFFSVHRL